MSLLSWKATLDKAANAGRLAWKAICQKKLILFELKRADYRTGKGAYAQVLSGAEHVEIVTRINALKHRIAELKVAALKQQAGSFGNRAAAALRTASNFSRIQALKVSEALWLARLGKQLRRSSIVNPSSASEIAGAKIILRQIDALGAEMEQLAAGTYFWARRPLLLLFLVAGFAGMLSAITLAGKGLMTSPGLAQGKGSAVTADEGHQSPALTASSTQSGKSVPLSPTDLKFQEAAVAFQDGRYEHAFSVYNEVIAAQPDNARAFSNRGWAFFCGDKPDLAIHDFDTALKLARDDAETFYRRGCALARTSRFDEAIHDFTEAIRCKQRYAAAYEGRAEALLAVNQMDKAVTDLDEAIQCDPDDSTLLATQAAILTKLNKIDRALADIDKIIRLSPDDPVAHFTRGQLYLDHARQASKSIAEFQKAIQLSPYYAEAYTKLGEAFTAKGDPASAELNKSRGLFLSGRHDGALKELNLLIAAQPKMAEAYVERGRVALMKVLNGKTDIKEEDALRKEAAESFTEAIRLQPQNSEFYVERGFALLTRADTSNEAKNDFDHAVALNPRLASAHLGLGELWEKKCLRYEVQEACGPALEEYDKAIQLDPQNAEAYAHRGFLLSYTFKRYEDAVRDYSRVIDLSPPLESYHVRVLGLTPAYEAYKERAICYEQMEKLEMAKNDVTQLIRMYPRNAVNFQERGRLNSRLGLGAEAESDFGRAAELNPLLAEKKALPEAENQSRGIVLTEGEKNTVVVLGSIFVGLCVWNEGLNENHRMNLRRSHTTGHLCQSCAGLGLGFECRSCGGTGRGLGDPVFHPWCLDCEGTGYAKCQKCGGTGWID